MKQQISFWTKLFIALKLLLPENNFCLCASNPKLTTMTSGNSLNNFFIYFVLWLFYLLLQFRFGCFSKVHVGKLWKDGRTFKRRDLIHGLQVTSGVNLNTVGCQHSLLYIFTTWHCASTSLLLYTPAIGCLSIKTGLKDSWISQASESQNF